VLKLNGLDDFLFPFIEAWQNQLPATLSMNILRCMLGSHSYNDLICDKYPEIQNFILDMLEKNKSWTGFLESGLGALLNAIQNKESLEKIEPRKIKIIIKTAEIQGPLRDISLVCLQRM